MSKGCWLVKQEPADYAWASFVKEGRTARTGVRNSQFKRLLELGETRI